MKNKSSVNSKVELLCKGALRVMNRIINHIKWIMYIEQYCGYEHIELLHDLYEIIEFFITWIL